MYITLLHITTHDYFILLHFSISLLRITTKRDITTITSYYYTIHYYTILHYYYSLLVNTLSLLNSKFWEKLLLDYFHYYIISITTLHNYYLLLLLLPLLIPPTWRWSVYGGAKEIWWEPLFITKKRKSLFPAGKRAFRGAEGFATDLGSSSW